MQSVEDFVDQTLKEIQSEEDFSLASDAELNLPSGYEDEIAAAKGLEHVDNLLQVRWDLMNAKFNHQDEEKKKLAASEMASQAILTKIKRQHPDAWEIVLWVLDRRAEANVKARAERESEAQVESREAVRKGQQ